MDIRSLVKRPRCDACFRNPLEPLPTAIDSRACAGAYEYDVVSGRGGATATGVLEVAAVVEVVAVATVAVDVDGVGTGGLGATAGFCWCACCCCGW